MNSVVTPEIREVMEAVHYRPAVSIIIPFKSKINLQTEIKHSLKIAADKVERELTTNFSEEISSLVMKKLRNIINDIKLDTNKKSIAIYVSPVFEKVLYLDIAVEEKIIVDESFEIRDLIYSKKQLNKYLVLLLSGKEIKIYLGNSTTFIRILSHTPESVNAYVNEPTERVANFSDTSEYKEVLMEKFLHHIDHELSEILNVYHLPLFVLGAERISGHFKNISKHAETVAEYIHGNYENTSLQELKELLKPHINQLKIDNQKKILNQLEEAAGSKKLVFGMKEVWHEAMNLKGRLLVVEKNYMYAAQHSSVKDVIYKALAPDDNFSCIKDAVDEIIETVLGNGGDVEFVEKDVLKSYHHIALIKFY